MRITLHGLVAGLALVAFISGVAQPSAASAQAGQAQAQKSESARGELRSVDAAKQTLTISADGKDQVFQYNDQTKVTGAQGGVAGLATMSGSQVTVQFTMKGAERLATSIEIAAAK
jgi:Cu/Ag efflux protein CusF